MTYLCNAHLFTKLMPQIKCNSPPFKQIHYSFVECSLHILGERKSNIMY